MIYKAKEVPKNTGHQPNQTLLQKSIGIVICVAKNHRNLQNQNIEFPLSRI